MLRSNGSPRGWMSVLNDDFLGIPELRSNHQEQDLAPIHNKNKICTETEKK